MSVGTCVVVGSRAWGARRGCQLLRGFGQGACSWGRVLRLFQGRGGQGVAASCCVGLGKGHVRGDVGCGCFKGVGLGETTQCCNRSKQTSNKHAESKQTGAIKRSKQQAARTCNTKLINQAASKRSKQQAASSKQQAAGSRQQAASARLPESKRLANHEGQAPHFLQQAKILGCLCLYLQQSSHGHHAGYVIFKPRYRTSAKGKN